jgi:hypothetical protein
MNYKLSNIARTAIKGTKNHRIVYYPHGSVMDSILGSIPGMTLTLYESDITCGASCVLLYDNAYSGKENEIAKYFHANIVNLRTSEIEDESENCEHVYQFNLADDSYGLPKPIKPLSIQNKTLLYIRDKDPYHTEMIIRFLDSQNIKYDAIDPKIFYNRDIQEIYGFLSQYKVLLNNTNKIDLLAGYRAGCLPITFKNQFAKNKYLRLIEDNKIHDLIYSEHAREDNMNEFDNLYNFDKFVDRLMSHINHVVSTPFIL